MEGGKHFAKFASDGMQMVYHAAEKKSKEYIASSTASSAEKEYSETPSPTPFFAATDDHAVANNKGTITSGVDEKHKPHTVLEDSFKTTNAVADSPKPFYAATKTDNDGVVQDVTKMDSSIPNERFTATKTANVAKPIPPASTSSLLRSGGRMFAKFVGDGLQMVQRAATSKEKRFD